MQLEASVCLFKLHCFLTEICIYRNAIKKLGFQVKDIVTSDDIERATAIVFPGVGSFGQAITVSIYLSYFDHIIIHNYSIYLRAFTT